MESLLVLEQEGESFETCTLPPAAFCTTHKLRVRIGGGLVPKETTGLSLIRCPEAILSYVDVQILNPGEGIVVTGSGLASFSIGNRTYYFMRDNSRKEWKDNTWYVIGIKLSLSFNAVYQLYRWSERGNHLGLYITRLADERIY